MSIEIIREINKAWGEKFLDYELENGFWDYEPFSDNYWLEKHKIVFCNLEAVGGLGEGNHLYSINTFQKQWHEGHPTIKWTAVFTYCLYKRLQGENLTINELKALYNNIDELLSVMENITYMNLRKEESWGDNNNLQKEQLHRFLDPKYAFYPGEDDNYEEIDRECPNKPFREFTLQFIEELEPDIFIVSGTVGCEIINIIYEGKIKLDINKTFKYNKTLFVSVNHPARSFGGGYQYIIDRTAKIIYDYYQGVPK